MIPVVHTSFHTRVNLHKNRIMPKGKMRLNRASTRTPYPPFPFLAPVQMPGILSKISGFPFTQCCLDIIEPRFEPPTARGRLLGPASFLFPSLTSRSTLWVVYSAKRPAEGPARVRVVFNVLSASICVHPRSPRPILYSLLPSPMQ
jgi:hypothetical protein